MKNKQELKLKQTSFFFFPSSRQQQQPGPSSASASMTVQPALAVFSEILEKSIVARKNDASDCLYASMEAIQNVVGKYSVKGKDTENALIPRAPGLVNHCLVPLDVARHRDLPGGEEDKVRTQILYIYDTFTCVLKGTYSPRLCRFAPPFLRSSAPPLYSRD